MTSQDTRQALLAALSTSTKTHRLSRTPTPIRVGQLTDLQLAGTACIWCGAAIMAEDRHEVGSTGYPAQRLYGCVRCVVVCHRRLPAWPEPGSL